MKKGTIIFLAVIGFVIIWGVIAYNGLVSLQEKVDKSWADVENQYQRRLSLIPNLVSTVKGYAAHEQNTLNQVIEARSKATQITLNVDDLNEESLKKFQQVQGELSSALSRLMAISESYPDLKANTNFLELQAQLEGTENRIAVERRNFNEATRKYNQGIRRFPNVIFAGMMGFEKKPYFQAEEGASQTPKVEF